MAAYPMYGDGMCVRQADRTERPAVAEPVPTHQLPKPSATVLPARLSPLYPPAHATPSPSPRSPPCHRPPPHPRVRLHCYRVSRYLIYPQSHPNPNRHRRLELDYGDAEEKYAPLDPDKDTLAFKAAAVATAVAGGGKEPGLASSKSLVPKWVGAVPACVCFGVTEPGGGHARVCMCMYGCLLWCVRPPVKRVGVARGQSYRPPGCGTAGADRHQGCGRGGERERGGRRRVCSTM
jgi:hypothetical protein